MKKILFSVIISFCIILLAACEEDRSYTIDQVTIHAVIQENGVIQVQEQYTYTFNGSFNGLTRSIHSEEKNFNAYALDAISDDVPPIDSLKSLQVELDDEEEQYKIYQTAANESKSVLYTYDIHDSVKKYADVGKLVYSFFDSNNESDIHHLSITISTAATVNPADIYGYVREKDEGKTTIDGQMLTYENDLLRAGQDSYLTFLFPEHAVNEMKLTKDKQILGDEMDALHDWESRGEQLDAKMGQFRPIVYTLLAAVLILSILVARLHPNRTRKYMDDESLRQLLEKTDPVLLHYLNSMLTVSYESIIPALFSLKMRGVVRIEEVDSKKHSEEKTIRFTWIRTNSTVDAADEQLKDWLFTEETNGLASFVLENITDDSTESDEVKDKKGEVFAKRFSEWEKLVTQRAEFENIRHPYPMYKWISMLFIVITAGVFYYFISIDQLTVTEQFWLQIVLGVLTLIALICARYKFVTIFYYILLIILSFVFFTLTHTTIVGIGLFLLTAIASLSISSYVWSDEIGQIKHAMDQVFMQMFSKEYPLASTVTEIENQLLYAITLNVGESFAEQLDKEDFVKQLTAQERFAFQPVELATMDALTSPIFYSAITSSSSTSTTTTSSSSGGGGAGAF